MEKPLSEMTKTELENQDMSWNNIIGFGLIAVGIYVAYKIYKSK